MLRKLKPKNNWIPWLPWNKLVIKQKVAFAVLITMLVSLPIGLTLITQTKIPFRGEAGRPASSKRKNTPPIITTSNLPNAKQDKVYSATLAGEDIDVANNLSMTVKGLPSGIKLEMCEERTSGIKGGKGKVRKIFCIVSGEPKVSGRFMVEVILNDGKSTVSKSIPFTITGDIPVPTEDVTISACNVTVTPTAVNTDSPTTFTITIENTNSANYKWMQITRPSSDFIITGGESSGWGIEVNDSSIILTAGSLGPSESTNIIAIASLVKKANKGINNWDVKVSDDSDGTFTFTCTGALAAEIY